MIASLRGTVLETSLTGAIIEVGGVGLAFRATPATLAGLRVGEEGFVHTELVVREDALTLYGFADADERHCFRVLLGAKGVGAKLALAILAVHTPDALRRAVAADDGTRDTVETADALADLIYVIYGMALETGIDLASVLAEVQRSNMSKLGTDGKPVYREDGKVLKGPDYFPPNVEAVLRRRRLR